MRTEQEYRNLEAENASLRERLEKAENDAERWQYRYSFLQSGGAVFFSETGVTLRKGGYIIAKGATETEAIDAAIKAQKAAEIERERTARKTAQESLENYKGECTRLQHEVDRLKGEARLIDRREHGTTELRAALQEKDGPRTPRDSACSRQQRDVLRERT